MPYVSTVPDSLHQRLLAKNKTLRIKLNQNLISQLSFHSSNPNGNFNPRGGQVLIDSMKVSQLGSISYPICKFALAAWLSFFISVPSIISLFQYAFSSAIICVFSKSIACPVNSLLENNANYMMNKLILTKTILSKEIWKVRVRVYVIQFPSLHQGYRAHQPKDDPVQNKINLLTLYIFTGNTPTQRFVWTTYPPKHTFVKISLLWN